MIVSDAPNDMASLVDGLIDNIILYNIFPRIETNIKQHIHEIVIVV